MFFALELYSSSTYNKGRLVFAILWYLVYYCKNKRFTKELVLSIKSLLTASKIFQSQICVSFTWSIVDT